MLIAILFGDLGIVCYIFYFIILNRVSRFYNELKFCFNGIECIFQLCYMSRAILKQRPVKSWLPSASQSNHMKLIVI